MNGFRTWSLAAVVVVLAGTVNAQEDGSRIDLLVVYTPAAREDVGAGIEDAISARVDDTNAALRDSGVLTRIRLVHTAEIDYREVPRAGETRVRLSRPDDGHMDEVHDLRDNYAADLVALIVDRRFDTCGEAERSNRWPTTSYSAFSVSKTYCNSDEFIPALEHELGHSMGLSHDRYSEIHVCCESLNKPTAYSHGYVNQRAFEPGAPERSRWVTIMAYSDQCRHAGFGCSHIKRFSNPRLTFRGDPLGVAGDEITRNVVGPADAVRALNEHRMIVANWRVSPDATTGTGRTIRAADFRSLRERIDALRTRAGLSPFAWTDPVLIPGVTPIKAVHMRELRAALGGVYGARWLPRPTYTDPVVVPGTPIKLAHLVELQAYIAAVE